MIVIPLSVLDAAVIWWIFLSLSYTMKLLALRFVLDLSSAGLTLGRNNQVKLALYTNFKWILVVCVCGE